MSKRILLAGAALLGGVSLAASPLAAQRNCAVNGPATSSCTVSLVTEVTVHDLMRIDLSEAALDLGQPTVADFEAGHLNSATPVTVSVKANRPYKVTIESGTPRFDYSGAHPDPDKPATDLLWTTASGSFDESRNVGTARDLGGDDGATDGRDVDVHFRTKYSFAKDKPGSYSLDVKFTLAAK